MIVFLPAAVFCAVAVICWAVCAAIDHREPRLRQPHRAAAPAPAPQPFRLMLIEGGLKSSPAAAPAYFRPGQTPLRFTGAAGPAARSYGG